MPDAVDVNAALVVADVPVTVLPAAAEVNASSVAATVPVTSLPNWPVAELVNAASVEADVPEIECVPDAADVAAAFVVALDPVTVDPAAELVNAALVVALVPATPCAPDAVEVNAALVVALEPVTMDPAAVEVNAAKVCALVPVIVAGSAGLWTMTGRFGCPLPSRAIGHQLPARFTAARDTSIAGATYVAPPPPPAGSRMSCPHVVSENSGSVFEIVTAPVDPDDKPSL